MDSEAAHALSNMSFAAGHLSADPHTHIHNHLNELFIAGSDGVLSNVSEADQDYVVQNPSDSGKLVEFIHYKMTASTTYGTEQYENVDFPNGGTDITPWCTADHSVTADFNVKHTAPGDATNLVDVSTGDQLPGGVVGGTKRNPTPFDLTGADIVIHPGETLCFRTTLAGTNEDIAYLAMLAEYKQGREIDP